MKLTVKQTKALDYLEDDTTTELLFGGAAGGGKSVLGCYYQIKRRLKYPGSRGLIGRTVFQTLKLTTLKTFFEVAKEQGLVKGKHFWLTGAHDKENPNCIMFYNGSMIYLRDLKWNPSDPEFESLGSFEITDAFIDECSQCVEKAKDVVKSRIRFKLDHYCHQCANQEKKQILSHDDSGKVIEWICGNGHTTQGLIPKLIMTCNPAKNWTYKFYKGFKERTLPVYKKFIQALSTDNPNISRHYITNLLTMGKDLIQRLLYGNWEYTDDPLLLYPSYDKILEIFTNSFIVGTGEWYITADIAYQGSDKFVIGIWHGFVLKKIIAIDKIDETMVSAKIQELRIMYGVPISNVTYDADGLKRYVRQSAETGYLKDARQFYNNSKAVGGENYYNLKSQCYFKLAEMINESQIYCEDQEYRDLMISELEQIKQRERNDNTEPLRVEKKADLKERLGHSPDFVDMMAMRMLFVLEIFVTFATNDEEMKNINY